MKNFRGTLIASILIVGFAAYVYFFEFKKGQQEAERKDNESFVVKVDTSRVNRVEIKTSVAKVVLEKKENLWSLVEPMVDLADQGITNTFLENVTSEKVEEVVVEGESVNLAQFGLDKPVSFLTLGLDDGSKKEVKIGSKSYDSRLHAQVGDDKKVLLVNATWDTYLTKPSKEFRDKRVFRGESFDSFDRITIKSGRNGVTLHKKDGAWKLEGGETHPVSVESVNNFFDQIKGLRGSEFVAEEKNDKVLKNFGLNAPALSFELSGPASDGKKVSWQLLAAPGFVSKDTKGESGSYHIVSTDQKGIMSVAKGMVDAMTRTPDGFLDRKAPFAFKPEEVNHVRIQTPDLKLEAKKQGNDWKMVDPVPGKEIVAVKMSDTLNLINRFEVAEFLPKSEKVKGLVPPKNQITMSSEKGDILLDVTWGDNYTRKEAEGRQEWKRTYVKTQKFDRVFGVAQGNIEALPLKELLREAGAAKAPEASEPKTAH